MDKRFFVYILKCSNNTFYTGFTIDVENRMKMHAEGKGAKYVRAHLPFKLIYVEELPTKIDALKREFEIKQWSREKKIKELKLEKKAA